MKFGVNYTPSHGWFHAWLDPDWDGIDNDLKQISELGMDHVRIFPIWPYLQPNRTWINKKGVADVRRMVHIAGEHPYAARYYTAVSDPSFETAD